ncbi:hypothetical protein K505DRAFT_342923 [Melanomma pulvis-pyrius CBS 109.77]|uniref:C2H2-type domain-containing protein n=1 Tax=Melanomma pulvis-pyrius CBS 109.77 TaxID=1314802 RepID=A0A6A6WUR1_9PLEO|nr:hypothetical protein K505DRAFT_342923 [Melanomma pulvis-pyrius CBS 109.77]
MAVWCHRCYRSFRTYQALYQHYRDSVHHHECPDCDFDGEFRDELLDHFRKEGCRTHRLSHKSAKCECLGCCRMFKTYGGMIIHLETGACVSGIDRFDVYETVAECRRWPDYIDQNFYEEILCRTDLEDYNYTEKVYPFNCSTCQQTFSKLSSLFQHVESPSCGQTLDKGSILVLRRFLRDRLDRY